MMFTTASRLVTNFDHYRLFRLLERLRQSQPTGRGAYDALEGELDRADVIDPRHIPSDVITMNSTATAVDLDTGREMQFTVVFPGEAAPEAGRISVLAPVGLALLGSRAGDDIEWPIPGGIRRLRIDDVQYQPESAGRFDL
jgi:regulator of nucleoside diphosphate kinase